MWSCEWNCSNIIDFQAFKIRENVEDVGRNSCHLWITDSQISYVIVWLTWHVIPGDSDEVKSAWNVDFNSIQNASIAVVVNDFKISKLTWQQNCSYLCAKTSNETDGHE